MRFPYLFFHDNVGSISSVTTEPIGFQILQFLYIYVYSLILIFCLKGFIISLVSRI